jgi:hypothetical protein
MRHKVSFADLHNPLFMRGHNLGQKLSSNPSTRNPVQLMYDTELMCLIIQRKGFITLVPHATVSSMDVENPEALKINWDDVLPQGFDSPACQDDGPIVGQVDNHTKPALGRTGRGTKAA